MRAVNEMAVGWRRHIVATRRDGRSYDQTYGQMARNLIGAVEIDADDPTAGTLTIEYRHSATGAALVDAGYVTASREYAIGVDPFEMPRALRGAALARWGHDFDDAQRTRRA